jgi:hypothetical protein
MIFSFACNKNHFKFKSDRFFLILKRFDRILDGKFWVILDLFKINYKLSLFKNIFLGFSEIKIDLTDGNRNEIVIKGLFNESY